MRYLSVCSGIEAVTVAWDPLGWTPVAFAETDAFPAAVLAHHYPGVPNLGDLTKFQEWPDDPCDLLVGGTPCQAFSVAGLRAGLADPRGSLLLTYLALAARRRPRWLVWENVPGVLSIDGGRAFGAFLGALGELGYGFAYRVLDAQYFGVAQRRRRVFVVGCLGDWRRAAAVLFERASVFGHPAPRRETGQGLAGTLGGSSQSGGFRTTDLDNNGAFIPEIANPLTHRMHKGINTTCDEGQTMVTMLAHPLTAKRSLRLEPESETLVAHALRADGFDASEDGTGRGTPLVPEVVGTLPGTSPGLGWRMGADEAMAGHLVPVAIRTAQTGANGHGVAEDCAHTLDSAQGQAVAFAIQGAATRENPACGPDGVGVRDDDCAYTIEARSEVQAVAFHENQRAETTLNDTAGSLKGGGGKPGQGYPAVLAFDTYNQDVSEELTQTLCSRGDTPGGNAHLVPAVAFEPRYYTRDNKTGGAPSDTVQLSATNAKKMGDAAPCVAFQESQSGFRLVDAHPTLDSHNGSRRHHGVVEPIPAISFNWQNGGGYGEAHDGLGITEEGVGPLSCSQTPAVAFRTNQTSAQGPIHSEELTDTLAQDHPPAVAFRNDASRNGEAVTPSPDAEGRVRLRDPGFNVYEELAPTLDASAPHGVGQPAERTMRVRRLTPKECERLQGFPDDYTQVPYRGKPAADGPRYKALGNSMAVPVMRWLGRRIALVDALPEE